MTFYDGRNCTGNTVMRVLGDRPLRTGCKNKGSPCYGKNDEIKSVRIAKPSSHGLWLEVYDDPTGAKTDDYTTVTVTSGRQDNLNICIGSFQQALATPGYRVKTNPKNGLDRKISYIRLHWLAEDGRQIR